MPAGPPSSVGQARRCGQLAGQPGGTVHTGTRCGDAPSARRRVCQGRDSSSRTDKKHSGMLDSPASSSSSWSNTITRQKAGLPDAAGGSLPARWPHVQREQPCRLQLLPQPKEKREDPPPGGWEGTHRNHGPAPASLAWSGMDTLGTRLPLQAPLWTVSVPEVGRNLGDCRTRHHCPEGPSPASGLHGLSLHHLRLVEGANCLGTFLANWKS